MTVHEKDNGKKKKKKRSWWNAVLSCCGDPNVYNLDGTNKEFVRQPARKRVLSRITRMKKTVPIEIAGNAMDCETKIGCTSDGKKENNCSGRRESDECLDQIKRQKQPKTILSNKPGSDAAILPVQDIASLGDYLSKSAPLYRTVDPVQTQTHLHTSNCNSPESSRYSTPDQVSPIVVDPDKVPTGETDPSKIVPIITVAIFLVLLFGRGFAVLSMCVYFYIVSRFKSESTENKDQMKKGNREIDLNSDMHKKMVVLRGFLERGKKKPATNLRSSSM